MKYVIIFVAVVAIVGGVVWYSLQPEPASLPPAYTATTSEGEGAAEDVATNAPRTEIIAENLSIPWEVVFLPDGELLVTERIGRVVLLKAGVTIPIAGVRHVGEGGLLGATLHPNFTDNNYLYLYQTTEAADGLVNRVDRYTLVDATLTFDRTIIDNLPGAMYHDGGRIAFGPDGYLYVTLGDAGDPDAAQDSRSLAGSILRYTDEGTIPEDNPFGNAVYSYGHRNAQGLAWDSTGVLWSSEHGRSGIRSGYDEINRIAMGANYGWPVVEGDETGADFILPVRHSGADTTWAPGGLAHHDGYLYMPGLRGETLYRATLSGAEISGWDEFFVGEYGRLRTISVGSDGLLYLTTSNRDGRGSPASNDDVIIRINPRLLGE